MHEIWRLMRIDLIVYMCRLRMILFGFFLYVFCLRIKSVFQANSTDESYQWSSFMYRWLFSTIGVQEKRALKVLTFTPVRLRSNVCRNVPIDCVNLIGNVKRYLHFNLHPVLMVNKPCPE